MNAENLVIVANRMPVCRDGSGTGVAWKTSPGGLVSALTPLLRQSGGIWVGWSGTTGRAPEPFEYDGIRNVPISISRGELDGFYSGFANGTLWPLYHDCVREPTFRRDWWPPYVEINRRFADATAEVAPREAIVWVHDYHLQLVPGMLRERRPDLHIGFFLHIPFPPQELFAQLPWRRELLRGLLGSDVVGFQTRVASRNFGVLAKRYAGARGTSEALEYRGRVVKNGTYPISIDFARFERQATSAETLARVETIRSRAGGRRILLGVDRLDYTKGIDIRLEAFRELVESGRASADECVLIQTAVPSRQNLAAYRRERERVERLIGEIGGEHGQLGRAAVHYQHKNLPFEELVALYRAADVMLVTPLRDGMNLVAKEYVASRPDERGVLVLSEFAGAAEELRSALLVNPHDVDGVTAAMAAALRQPEAEQRRRMRAMRRVVRQHDVFDWAHSFLASIETCTV